MSLTPDPARIDSIRARLAALKSSPEADEARATQMADDLLRIRVTLDGIQSKANENQSLLEQVRAEQFPAPMGSAPLDPPSEP
jgi:hypothetical protein